MPARRCRIASASPVRASTNGTGRARQGRFGSPDWRRAPSRLRRYWRRGGGPARKPASAGAGAAGTRAFEHVGLCGRGAAGTRKSAHKHKHKHKLTTHTPPPHTHSYVSTHSLFQYSPDPVPRGQGRVAGRGGPRHIPPSLRGPNLPPTGGRWPIAAGHIGRTRRQHRAARTRGPPAGRLYLTAADA